MYFTPTSAASHALRTAIGLGAALALALAVAPADGATTRVVAGHVAVATAGSGKVTVGDGGQAGGVAYSSGKPRDARLTIPSLTVQRLRVVAYRGRTDDGPGTRIQNRGIAASPYGGHGGTGPGGLGNYQVTAHRTAHGGVFRHTPSLHRGAKAYVDVGRWRYIYRIVKTRWVSFRSARSLRRQRAAVPGKPGVKPDRGYITISTCATPEDHAHDDYWTDRFGNPEHRIDKIGVLVGRVLNPDSNHRHL